MADERQRYLAQQIELGGAEIILGRPRAQEQPPAMPTERSSEPSAPPSPSASGADPKWRRGAPPIPGPGMTVLSPTPVLLGNDLGALPTLDAVAERIRTTYCCDLCPSRTNAVPGEGNPQARLVLRRRRPRRDRGRHGAAVRGTGGPSARHDSRGY